MNKAEAILEELDLTVMTDFIDPELSKPCFYIGWPQELGAGIWGGSVSPNFDTELEALQWLIDNEKEIRAKFN